MQSPEAVLCPACRAPLSGNERVCAACGQLLRASDPVSPPAAEAVHVRCSKCGGINAATSGFCGQCGVRFGIQAGGFWIRVGAYLMDSLVLAIPGTALQLLADSVAGPATSTTTTYVLGHSQVSTTFNTGSSLLSLLFSFALAFGYFGFSWTRSGSTLGMRVCGLRVRDCKTGQNISWGQTIGRYLMIVVGLCCFCLGVLWVGWSADKRGWHDLAVGSEVIRERR